LGIWAPRVYNACVQANAQGGLASAVGRTFERVSVVKALAGRKVPASIAHAFSPSGAELVVVERYAGLDSAALQQLEEDARKTMSLRHPNVATVRDVWREKDELCVACEFVEGETLEELRRLGVGGKELSIEVGVRVVVDVLGAISAIHTHGAGGVAHGEVTAANAIVGFDGVTRVVRPFRGRVAGKTAEADWFSYAAPEVLKGAPADARADLYSVGVLLWETLSRRKLFPKATREGRAARTMPVGKPTAPTDAAWATPLAAVAERALANDPAARYTTAAEMAAAVRLAVRSKLAMPPRVSAAVDKLAGEKILARRNANALPEASDAARVSVRPSRPPLPAEATRALSSMRASSRPPTPNPGAVAMPVIPKQAPLPSVATKTPAPKPVEARTGPRPAAPPLKLAEAKAPESEEPISLEEFGEEPPTKPIAAVAAAAVVAPVVAAKPAAPAPVVAPPPVEVMAAVTAAPVVPEPTPAIAAPAVEPIVMPSSPSEPTPEAVEMSVVPAGLGKKKGRVAMMIAGVLVALIAVGALVRVVMAPSADPKSTAHAATGATTIPTVTATATVTSTATATVTATATTSAPAASDSATPPEPDTSATSTTTGPAPDSSHRPHVRPRPTYDPMGI
jgi:eukaryotic-like serine/threonine-protein kinase